MNSLSRKKDCRESLLRNLATSLILYEEIRTTQAKAKAVKPVVEHLIGIGKKQDLYARRRLLGYLFDENATKKCLEVLAKRYRHLNSGFINTYKIGPRLGDAAEMVILKLVSAKVEESVTAEEKIEKTESKKEVNKKNAPKEKVSGKTAKTGGKNK